MTEEQRKAQVLNNLEDETEEIEGAIIKLSDYPAATESLLASLADLHNTQAQILFGAAKHFDSGTLYAPPEAELAADEAAVPEQDSDRRIVDTYRVRDELMETVNEAVMRCHDKADLNDIAYEAAYAAKAVFDKAFGLN